MADPLEDLQSSRFAEFAPRAPFSKGTVFGAWGQPCFQLYFLAEGQVILSRPGADGEEHALYLLGPGELFGAGALLPERQWLATARAVTDGVVHTLPGSQFPQLAQAYPELAAHAFKLLAARLEATHRRLEILTSPSARQRLLGLLALLAGDSAATREGEVWLPLEMTQAQLGSMVCLARETVARTLADLEAQGLIRREGRKGLWLRRPAAAPQSES